MEPSRIKRIKQDIESKRRSAELLDAEADGAEDALKALTSETKPKEKAENAAVAGQSEELEDDEKELQDDEEDEVEGDEEEDGEDEEE